MTVAERLHDFVSGDGRICVVKAPPGSGKSHNLVHALDELIDSPVRIAIAAQTNNQVDDLCRQISDAFVHSDIVRFSSGGYAGNLPSNVVVIDKVENLPSGSSLVVGTVAKWAISDIVDDYDVLFVDEAWQMTWADFLTLRDVAARYVLIGDPGQIPPVVTVDVDRWEVSPVAPHRPAPDVILDSPELEPETTRLNLDTCWRLPHDSVGLVRTFYDFDFTAQAAPGERYLRPRRALDSARGTDRAIASLATSSTVVLTHPSDTDGAVFDPDTELAEVVADLAVRLLDLECEFSAQLSDVASPPRLEAPHIGIVSTHNLMNTAIEQALPASLRGPTGIRVTTPERWQGLQRPVMIAVHPLSGIVIPSSFDLETGRLCVMASRHRSACFFVTRDNVGRTLDGHLPSADQALGRADIVGRGHAQHTAFWKYHLDRDLIV